MSLQTGSYVRALRLTALLSALAGAILLHVVPATAAVQQIFFSESLEVGFPPLIVEDTPEHMPIAPADPITAQNEQAADR